MLLEQNLGKQALCGRKSTGQRPNPWLEKGKQTVKLDANQFELEKFDELEEIGLQKGRQAICQDNDQCDGAVQDVKQTASTDSKEDDQPHCPMCFALPETRFFTAIPL